MAQNWPTHSVRQMAKAKQTNQETNKPADDRQSVSVAADRCGGFQFE